MDNETYASQFIRDHMYKEEYKVSEKDTQISDKINPSHYTDCTIECIDVIESWDLGFHLGNTIKYIKRAGSKEGNTYEDDIRKAIWYLERSIQK